MTYTKSNRDGTIETLSEKTGVLHMVHGWVQQGHPHGPLYPSKVFSKKQNHLDALSQYLERSGEITQFLDCFLEKINPDVHKEYRNAFNAGVWDTADTGPWLGRALLYKAQVSFHKDQNDDGLSACFPVGRYTGGEMIIPSLGAKFSYRPGDVFIFYAGKMHHQVAPWVPVHQTHFDLNTTGRIGTVLFFPRHSLTQLRGKPAGWGKKTRYGQKKEEETTEEETIEYWEGDQPSGEGIER
ncbi:hypothetical protein BDN72DRAFT_782036 [Pluteus cervinus]|uniref:Uncharacterized protein n=1 Tax=Pluteus cervinus TaxID=181527 RepID=A0ACD2ZZC9_9AGAR|nr:hypothetical protein BDN72DRAFT_782036 [Pluteus cervinus]